MLSNFYRKILTIVNNSDTEERREGVDALRSAKTRQRKKKSQRQQRKDMI